MLRNKAAVARAAIEQLEAELAQASVNLDYTTLRAPTDGVVLAKLKEVGEIAVPGGFAGSGDLIRLANLTDMRAEVDVNEADLNRVHMGSRRLVTPDAYPDARYAAEVVKLYPQVDRQKGTLKVEVQILEPDDEAAARHERARHLPAAGRRPRPAAEPAVLVPAAAVQRDARGDSFVWVVSDGRVRRAAHRDRRRRRRPGAHRQRPVGRRGGGGRRRADPRRPAGGGELTLGRQLVGLSYFPVQKSG